MDKEHAKSIPISEILGTLNIKPKLTSNNKALYQFQGTDENDKMPSSDANRIQSAPDRWAPGYGAG
jgi:hypothetical protein